MSPYDTYEELMGALMMIHDEGYRLVVLHTSEQLMLRVAEIASLLRYFEIGYAWILTETSLTSTNKDKYDLPLGVLTIEGVVPSDLTDLLLSSLLSMVYATHNLTANGVDLPNCSNITDREITTEQIVR